MSIRCICYSWDFCSRDLGCEPKLLGGACPQTPGRDGSPPLQPRLRGVFVSDEVSLRLVGSETVIFALPPSAPQAAKLNEQAFSTSQPLWSAPTRRSGTLSLTDNLVPRGCRGRVSSPAGGLGASAPKQFRFAAPVSATQPAPLPA